jgi:hypothetical protein
MLVGIPSLVMCCVSCLVMPFYASSGSNVETQKSFSLSGTFLVKYSRATSTFWFTKGVRAGSYITWFSAGTVFSNFLLGKILGILKVGMMLLQVVFGVIFASEGVHSAVSIFSNFSLPYLLILLYFDWMLIVLKVKSPPIIFFTFCLLMFLKDFWIRLLWSCTSYKMQSIYEMNLPLSQTGHEQARSSTGQAVALARAFPTPSFLLRCPVP